MIKKIVKWAFSTEKVSSDKNGEIKINRWFGRYDVECGHCFQSGPYVTNMWKKMINLIPLDDADFHPKHILMLGLGGGGGIEILKKKYPKANIVAIEHDPVMVDIAKRIVFKKMKYSPEIFTEDAKIALEKLIKSKRSFDIVMVDIYNGIMPSPLMYEDEFIQLIKNILKADGYLFVNFYRRRKLLKPIFSKQFSFWKDVTYKYNRLGIFRHFGNGMPGDPAPEGFIPKEQSPTYHALALIRPLNPKFVGEKGCMGVRYSWKWLAFEYYKSDIEPKLEKFKGFRFVIWYPISHVEKRKGWVRNLTLGSGWQLGFAKAIPNYWESWSDHAKRHKKVWEKISKTEYELVRTDIEEFQTAYYACGKLNSILRKGFMHSVRFHYKNHKNDVHFVLIKRRSDEKPVAGFISVDYPDISQSVHMISFINKGLKKTSVGYSFLIDWYDRCLESGITWLSWGLVYKDGDQKGWRGYSKFKRQFGLYLIRFPRPYFRMTLWS